MVSPMTRSGKYDEIVHDEITVKLPHKWLKNWSGIVVINCACQTGSVCHTQYDKILILVQCESISSQIF